jgi:hypothetical protein
VIGSSLNAGFISGSPMGEEAQGEPNETRPVVSSPETAAGGILASAQERATQCVQRITFSVHTPLAPYRSLAVLRWRDRKSSLSIPLDALGVGDLTPAIHR